MAAIRVGIVDDHALVREGLRLILESQPDLEVVGEAGDSVSALALVAHRRPQIMLVDLTLDGGDGVALIRDLTARHPRIADHRGQHASRRGDGAPGLPGGRRRLRGQGGGERGPAARRCGRSRATRTTCTP